MLEATYTTQARTIHYFTEDLGNGIDMDMVYIPEGSFQMGAPEDEPDRQKSETPQHRVFVPSFFISATTVTQVQWQQIVLTIKKGKHQLNAELSHFKGDSHPVDQVSWIDATEFCQHLSHHTQREYRLPSEAEWEYACRAGTTTPFHCGETILPDLANYNCTYTYGRGKAGMPRSATTPVREFLPNAFGLYDMHGNVWEWCQDTWHSSYSNPPTDGSAWIDKSSNARVLRGGSWLSNPRYCRSASRNYTDPDDRINRTGFRVVCFAPRTLS